MSKSQRTKGACGEREVCRILSDELGQAVHRELSQPRDSGCDIKVGPFNLEIKRRKGIAVHEWMEQCERSCVGTERHPVVICRGDGKPWLAIVPLQDWIDMAREAV